MRTLALLLFALSLSAQPNVNNYIAYKSTSLSAAAEKVTVQAVAGASKTVRFTTATAYCSVACVVTLSRTGTAATATTLTPTPVTIQTPAATAAAFSSSDAGAGTTLAAYRIAAGASITLDISQMFLPANGAGLNNFSMGTDSITGTASIQINWREE